MQDGNHEWKGISHVQFACSDMERTIRFWESMGMKCTLKLVLHNPDRYHFFGDVGRSSVISYWYWPDRKLTPPPPHDQRDRAGFYHVAFHVDSEDELESMRRRLEGAGIKVSGIEGRHMVDKSIYFQDPDGVQVEFACPMFNLEGVVEHDGKGTLIPRSEGAKLEKRTLDGPVHFETRYK